MKEIKKHIDAILARYITGLYTRRDAKTFFQALQSDSVHSEIEKEMDKVWENSSDSQWLPSHYEQYKTEAQLLLNKLQKKEKRFTLYPLIKYAAVVILILVLGIGGFTYMHSKTESAVAYTEMKVKNGECQRLTLPDGTHVILNAGSFIRYPSQFTTDTRWVEMDGEAFFEVKRADNKPFIVRTHDADVKVLGTSFNIKAYTADEQLAVSVCTGKVQVDMPEAMMRLFPNEQLIFTKKNGELQKRNEDVKKATGWMNGGLYFNKTPIHSVVLELERRYNCRIEFAAGAIYDEYIYGEHDNKNLESVLKSIQYSTDIRYKKESDKIVLYKK